MTDTIDRLRIVNDFTCYRYPSISDAILELESLRRQLADAKEFMRGVARNMVEAAK